MQRQYNRPDVQFRQRSQYRQPVQQRQQIPQEPQPQIQQYSNQRYDYADQGGGDPNFTKNIAVFLFSIVFMLGAGYGAYYWHNSQTEGPKDELFAKTEDEPAAVSSTGEVKSSLSSNEQVAYKGNVGGLELNLPENYAVIVKVDGNYGDSERTILHVSEKLGEGVYRDVLDDYIEVEVTIANRSAKKELESYQKQLSNSGYTLSEQFDAKVSGYKGYLMTGQSTFAQICTYYINNGGYSYRFSKILPLGQENKDDDNMLAVLNGMTLGSAGL